MGDLADLARAARRSPAPTTRTPRPTAARSPVAPQPQATPRIANLSAGATVAGAGYVDWRTAQDEHEPDSLWEQVKKIGAGIPAGLVQFGVQGVQTAAAPLHLALDAARGQVNAGRGGFGGFMEEYLPTSYIMGTSMGETVGSNVQFLSSLAPGGMAPSETEWARAVREGRWVGKALEDIGNAAIVAGGAGAAIGRAGGAAGTAARLGALAEGGGGTTAVAIQRGAAAGLRGSGIAGRISRAARVAEAAGDLERAAMLSGRAQHLAGVGRALRTGERALNLVADQPFPLLRKVSRGAGGRLAPYVEETVSERLGRPYSIAEQTGVERPVGLGELARHAVVGTKAAESPVLRHLTPSGRRFREEVAEPLEGEIIDIGNEVATPLRLRDSLARDLGIKTDRATVLADAAAEVAKDADRQWYERATAEYAKALEQGSTDAYVAWLQREIDRKAAAATDPGQVLTVDQVLATMDRSLGRLPEAEARLFDEVQASARQMFETAAERLSEATNPANLTDELLPDQVAAQRARLEDERQRSQVELARTLPKAVRAEQIATWNELLATELPPPPSITEAVRAGADAQRAVGAAQRARASLRAARQALDAAVRDAEQAVARQAADVQAKLDAAAKAEKRVRELMDQEAAARQRLAEVRAGRPDRNRPETWTTLDDGTVDMGGDRTVTAEAAADRRRSLLSRALPDEQRDVLEQVIPNASGELLDVRPDRNARAPFAERGREVQKAIYDATLEAAPGGAAAMWDAALAAVDALDLSPEAKRYIRDQVEARRDVRAATPLTPEQAEAVARDLMDEQVTTVAPESMVQDMAPRRTSLTEGRAGAVTDARPAAPTATEPTAPAPAAGTLDERLADARRRFAPLEAAENEVQARVTALEDEAKTLLAERAEVTRRLETERLPQTPEEQAGTRAALIETLPPKKRKVYEEGERAVATGVHPLAESTGKPADRRKALQSEIQDSQYPVVVNLVDGEVWASDGYVLVRAADAGIVETEPGVYTPMSRRASDIGKPMARGDQPPAGLAKLLRQSVNQATIEVRIGPAAGFDDPGAVLQLVTDDGVHTHVNAKKLAGMWAPGRTIHANPDPTKPVVVKEGGRTVGVIMPIRSTTDAPLTAELLDDWAAKEGGYEAMDAARGRRDPALQQRITEIDQRLDAISDREYRQAQGRSPIYGRADEAVGELHDARRALGRGRINSPLEGGVAELRRIDGEIVAEAFADGPLAEARLQYARAEYDADVARATAELADIDDLDQRIRRRPLKEAISSRAGLRSGLLDRVRTKADAARVLAEARARVEEVLARPFDVERTYPENALVDMRRNPDRYTPEQHAAAERLQARRDGAPVETPAPAAAPEVAAPRRGSTRTLAEAAAGAPVVQGRRARIAEAAVPPRVGPVPPDVPPAAASARRPAVSPSKLRDAGARAAVARVKGKKAEAERNLGVAPRFVEQPNAQPPFMDSLSAAAAASGVNPEPFLEPFGKPRPDKLRPGRGAQGAVALAGAKLDRVERSAGARTRIDRISERVRKAESKVERADRMAQAAGAFAKRTRAEQAARRVYLRTRTGGQSRAERIIRRAERTRLKAVDLRAQANRAQDRIARLNQRIAHLPDELSRPAQARIADAIHGTGTWLDSTTAKQVEVGDWLEVDGRRGVITQRTGRGWAVDFGRGRIEAVADGTRAKWTPAGKGAVGQITRKIGALLKTLPEDAPGRAAVSGLLDTIESVVIDAHDTGSWLDLPNEVAALTKDLGDIAPQEWHNSVNKIAFRFAAERTRALTDLSLGLEQMPARWRTVAIEARNQVAAMIDEADTLRRTVSAEAAQDLLAAAVDVADTIGDMQALGIDPVYVTGGAPTNRLPSRDGTLNASQRMTHQRRTSQSPTTLLGAARTTGAELIALAKRRMLDHVEGTLGRTVADIEPLAAWLDDWLTEHPGAWPKEAEIIAAAESMGWVPAHTGMGNLRNATNVSQLQGRLDEANRAYEVVAASGDNAAVQRARTRVEELEARLTRAQGAEAPALRAARTELAQATEALRTAIDADDEALVAAADERFSAARDRVVTLERDALPVFVPVEVAKQMQAQVAAWNHQPGMIFRGLARLNRALKTTLLPISARWHALNALSNALMAAAYGGVSPRQLARQWRVLRKRAGETGMGLNELLGTDMDVADTRGARLAQTGHTEETRAALGMFGEGYAEARTRVGAQFQRKVVDRGYGLSQFLDNGYRAAVYLAKLEDLARRAVEAGGEVNEATLQTLAAEAMRSSLRAMGDFTNMPAWQRRYARQVIPFMAWIKHTTQASLRLPVEHPIRFVWLTQLSAMYADPTMTAEELAFFGGRWDIGNGTALAVMGLSPIENPMENPILNPPALLRSVSPFLKIPFAGATGIDLNRGMQTTTPEEHRARGVFGQEVSRPLFTNPGDLLGYAAGQIPLVRNLRDAAYGSYARYGTGQPITNRYGTPLETGKPRVNSLAAIVGVPLPEPLDREEITRRREARGG